MRDQIQSPDVHGIFDKATGTVTYVIHQGKGSHCAIIDSVLDFNPHSGRTGISSAERVINYIKENDLKLEWILETHAHADHISAASFLKNSLCYTHKPDKNVTRFHFFYARFQLEYTFFRVCF